MGKAEILKTDDYWTQAAKSIHNAIMLYYDETSEDISRLSPTEILNKLSNFPLPYGDTVSQILATQRSQSERLAGVLTAYKTLYIKEDSQ